MMIRRGWCRAMGGVGAALVAVALAACGGSSSSSSAAAIEGVDSTGNNQSSVTFIGEFPRCPDAASTKPLGTGQGYDDCLTFLVPGGIKRISYNGTTDYINSPVTWAPK